MRNKTKLTILQIAAAFLLVGLLVGKTYDIGLNRPPLKYANIPDVTKGYIRNVDQTNRDQSVTISDVGPFDWENTSDLGQDKNRKEQKEWERVENENFIVYYQPDENAVWQGHALAVLRQAQESIEPLKELFGVYFYPSDVNGRRLSIYLPSTFAKYEKTTCQLLEQPNYDLSNVAGITITEIGPLGCLTRGILLNPDVFTVAPDHIDGYIKVLQHEMSHYVFFTALDYSKDVNHYLWLSEGIAEFFCNRHNKQQVSSNDSINYIRKNCQLDDEFPLEASYWAGESFFLFIEQDMGRKTVMHFLQNAYECSTDSVFFKMDMSSTELHAQWIDALTPHLMDTLDIVAMAED